MTTTLSVTGIAISAAALAVASITALFSRRQMELAERRRSRDFEATVVAELIGVDRRENELHYRLAVTNAGPAVAREVDLSIVEWTDRRPLGRTLCDSSVAQALLRGERREIALSLPISDVCFDNRSVSIELHTDYFDDNGLRNVRLAFVFDDSLVLSAA